ncbi:isoprenylcysteine carboxylmethyltransferase family protein [Shewanella sp. AS1]|uniref:methyltransferase family protein n=1 Tax=Shewanella sp. AS1 TaxID=2907626 RepID=UPI001F3BB0A7|nr:isoprenylcysteine carboxylmethyltransferase family protein [Shewanella sp. AS1]MCE9678092.1 isoprenylcysteine carboxylmethyltransferase family protein [Shewanella sp. AS1]
MERKSEVSRGANVRVPPPVLFLLCMLLGYGLENWLPSPFIIPDGIRYIALALMLLGTAMLVHLLLLFRRYNTSVEPWKPSSHLIKVSYYRYSRNPIYLLFCLYPIGLGCMFSSSWLILSVIPAITLVYLFAVKREERYLSQQFPLEYSQYCRQVRRWF